MERESITQLFENLQNKTHFSFQCLDARRQTAPQLEEIEIRMNL